MKASKDRYSLVCSAQRIEISKADFEAVRDERDELLKQLELECWFAEANSAVLSWQEKMTRFAARKDAEDIGGHLRIQIECELTSRMVSILVSTHGLRPYIDADHSDCPCGSACTIAKAIRNAWAHNPTRLLSVKTSSEDLWMSGPQIGEMPTNGSRKRIELFKNGVELIRLERKRTRRGSKALQEAILDLFPNGDIDIVGVINSHIRCMNRAMAAYRAKATVTVASRDSLLANHGLTGEALAQIAGMGKKMYEKIYVGEPFDVMLEELQRLRRQHYKIPIFELVQFGRGEFRVGSLRDARDYALELASELGLDSRKTEEVAALLDLVDGYPGDELCKDAPPLFKDAVERVYDHVQELSDELKWPGFVMRLLARRLGNYKSRQEGNG